MNIEEFRNYCLKKPCVTEEFPFDEETLVFKVCGKMFTLTGLNEEFRVNLKCEPERAIQLREQYPAIIPGYHMNKTHWNTVVMDGSLKDSFIMELIDHSYDLIVSKLPKKIQQEMKNI